MTIKMKGNVACRRIWEKTLKRWGKLLGKKGGIEQSEINPMCKYTMCAGTRKTKRLM